TIAESATLDDDYAYNAFLPRVSATGGIVWNESNQDLRYPESSRDREGKSAANNLTGSVQLAWTLFDGLRMFATRDRVAMIAEQGELTVKTEMVNTIAAVITNYYDVVRQKQQLKAIIEQMSVSEERVKLADRKFQVGTGAKPELLQARVDYNAERAQALQQEALIRQLKDQLNGLVGLQLPPEYDVADTILIDLELRKEDLLNNIEDTNFDLQVFKRNKDIAALAVRERRAELLPFIDFNAAYNYSKVENTKLLNPFGALFSETNGFNYGFTVNIPIFNGLNQRRLIQQSRINYNQQEIRYEQLKTNVNVALENAYTAYDNAREVLLVEEENISLARENVS